MLGKWIIFTTSSIARKDWLIINPSTKTLNHIFINYSAYLHVYWHQHSSSSVLVCYRSNQHCFIRHHSSPGIICCNILLLVTPYYNCHEPCRFVCPHLKNIICMHHHHYHHHQGALLKLKSQRRLDYQIYKDYHCLHQVLNCWEIYHLLCLWQNRK